MRSIFKNFTFFAKKLYVKYGLSNRYVIKVQYFFILFLALYSCNSPIRQEMNRKKWSAIHYASARNLTYQRQNIVKNRDPRTGKATSYETIPSLIDLSGRSIDVNERSRDEEGWTALRKACEKGYYGFVKELINRWPNDLELNIIGCEKSYNYKEERITTDKSTALGVVIKKRNNGCLNLLLQNRRLDLYKYYGDNPSPLFISCKFDNEYAFDKLITHGVSPNVYCKDNNYTPLIMCVMKQNYKYFLKLLSLYNIEVNKSLRSKRHKTPLVISLEKDLSEYVIALLYHKDIDINSFNLRNVLMRKGYGSYLPFEENLSNNIGELDNLLSGLQNAERGLYNAMLEEEVLKHIDSSLRVLSGILLATSFVTWGVIPTISGIVIGAALDFFGDMFEPLVSYCISNVTDFTGVNISEANKQWASERCSSALLLAAKLYAAYRIFATNKLFNKSYKGRWATSVESRTHGKWVSTKETMSKAAARYQSKITGKPANMSYKVNGVKFDGIKNGVLIDAKSGYKNFIDKSTGKFYKWFKGEKGLKNQAFRQITAAEGTPIEWYFENELVMKNVERILKSKNYKIVCKYKA